MIGLVVAIAVLSAIVFLLLSRGTRCAWRNEACMLSCQVIGPHSRHLPQTDERTINIEIHNRRWAGVR